MQPSPVRPPARLPLAVHAGWEAVLLVLSIALVVAIEAGQPHPPSLWRALVGPFSVLVLQAAAVAVSLRARNLNFAVTGITVLTAFFVADWTGAHGMSLLTAALLAVLLAAVVGAVLGAVAGLVGAPGWAASLVLLAITAAVGLAQGANLRQLPAADVPDNPRTWLTLFAVLGVVGSVAGGVLWLLTPVRRVLGVERDQPAGVAARMLGGLVGLGLSTAIAALAGVAYVIYVQAISPGQAGGVPLVPLAVVVFGGVSVFGGRGGVAGTALAALGAALLGVFGRAHGWHVWVSNDLFPAIMLAVGIALSLVLRRLSGDRPVPARPAPIWSPAPAPGFGPPPPFPAAMVPPPGYPHAPTHPVPSYPGVAQPAPAYPGPVHPPQPGAVDSGPVQGGPVHGGPVQAGSGQGGSGQTGVADSGAGQSSPVPPAAGGQ